MLSSVLCSSSPLCCSPLSSSSSSSCTASPKFRYEIRTSSLAGVGVREGPAGVRASSWLIGTELKEVVEPRRLGGRPCHDKWSRWSSVVCSAAAASRTQGIMETIPKEEEAGGAGVSSSYQGIQQANLQWERRRNSGTGPGPAPDVGRPQDGECSPIRASSVAQDLSDVAERGGPTIGDWSLLNAAAATALSLLVSLSGADFAQARPEGVNRPELLPQSFTTVIDVAGFLSPQQEGRIAQDLASLEDETGFKLRVLAQNYPETPGLAIKNFWQVDDNTIVFVADPSLGNILNFNVGSSVDLNVPRSFWSRLAGKYGNIFYWREMGEDASIEAAVAAIGQCLREPAGPYACSEIK